MRVIEIVASIAEGSAGPSYSVPRLSASLAQAGAEVSLFTVGARAEDERDGVRFRTFEASFASFPVLSRLRASRAMGSHLRQRAPETDIVHTHGLWLMPNVAPAHVARSARKAFVLSPRGMLGKPALAFSKVQKQLFWLALQQQAARSAAFLHATSDQEAQDIRAMRLPNPIAVIPNGIDVPDYQRLGGSVVRTVLSLGRIHPKKGLDRLIAAWAKLGASTCGWRLRIVGTSELDHAQQLRRLAAASNLANVSVERPLYGEAKLAAYREADLFVLPSRHENFGMTVAEALAAGTPVISTKGAPWSGLAATRSGWWVDHGAEPLAAALGEAMRMPRDELMVMGRRGRDWMARDFSWDRIGRDMLTAYQWAVAGGAPPAFVER